MGKKDSAPIANQLITPSDLENNAQNVVTTPGQVSAKVTSAKEGAHKPNRKVKGGEKKQNGFVRFFKKIGNAFKDMWNERKNVTWPPFAKVMASTGVVLLVVGIFFGVLMGFNSLFSWILGKIISL